MLGKIFCVAAAVMVAVPAQAAVYKYKIGSSNLSGLALSPLRYGLRMDNAFNDGKKAVFSFDKKGASMHMEWDDIAGTVRVYGTIYGGALDAGDKKIGEHEGTYNLDFTWTGVKDLGDLGKRNFAAGGGEGVLWGGQFGDRENGKKLYDVSNGAYSFGSFPDGYKMKNNNKAEVARGWITTNSDNTKEKRGYWKTKAVFDKARQRWTRQRVWVTTKGHYIQDIIFNRGKLVSMIPLPGTVGLAGLGLAGVATRRRRD